MKRMIVLLLCCGFAAFVNPDISGKEIRENMVVVNVEFPVRVSHKGNWVDNLKRSDFRLFENGKRVDINGFHMVRKKIATEKMELQGLRTMQRESRFFVLAFSVTNFNRFYDEGVRYFFDFVLNEKDKLLVFVNNTTLSYDSLEKKEKVFAEILSALNREGKKARLALRTITLSMENNIHDLISKVHLSAEQKAFARDVHTKRSILEFFLKYQAAWESYRLSFLRLNIYTLYNFASFLKRINQKKWVISFYQHETFPVLDRTSENGRKILNNLGLESARIYNQVSGEIAFERTFPHEAVSKLFYNLGATFNLVLIPTRIEPDSPEVKMPNIATSMENTLRELTKNTGGTMDFSTDLTRSIRKFSDWEDVYYLLTYAPEDPLKRGKIRIEVNNKQYKLTYDDNKRANFLKRRLKKQSKKMKILRLEELQFRQKELSFRLKNFKLKRAGHGKSGRLKINIIIKDIEGKILFDEDKILSPEKETTEVQIGFSWLATGKYDLLLDIQDQYTGRTVFEYLKLVVK